MYQILLRTQNVCFTFTLLILYTKQLQILSFYILRVQRIFLYDFQI